MAKVNVYVPNELQERMEGVTTNWSAVAQRAFERELLRIAAMKEDDVVARLRASKAECREEDEETGKERGADWARKAASWRELRRCDEYHELIRRENLAVDLCSFGETVLRTDNSSELRDFAEAWFGAEAGEEEATQDFLEGFIAGATEVWREVEHKL